MEQMPAPAQGQEQAPAEGQQGGDPTKAFQDLVTGISDGFAMLSQIAQEINPEGAQQLQAINDQYQQVVQQIMSGGAQGGAPAEGGQGMSSPEAGGAPGAMPMSHGMRRG